ncbi:MAG TPA: PhzF family phenazine biosynthesis protein [Xanthomonadaceae bacterium]|nr:PhzF family phenazine biosynthesis protein [Xanthomonadaceae bacterium]
MPVPTPAPRRYAVLDVFAERPGAGNPLAVVLDGDGLDEAQMQAIAQWTRLPETTFVQPAGDAQASYRIRIFSPRREVVFAGHPSVGTAAAVLDAGLATLRDGLLLQDGAAGRLPLQVETDTHGARIISVRTPEARVVEVATPIDPRLRHALKGIVQGALPPVLMDGGRRWWLAEVHDEASLRSTRVDWIAIAGLATATDAMGLCLFARANTGAEYDIVVRAFVGAPAQFEDAASGAANATLAAWLCERGRLPHAAGHYRVSQGREVGHDARLQMRVDTDGEVWSGGRVVSVVRGELHW